MPITESAPKLKRLYRGQINYYLVKDQVKNYTCLKTHNYEGLTKREVEALVATFSNPKKHDYKGHTMHYIPRK